MNILYLLSQLPEKTGSGIYTRALIDRAVRSGHRCSLVAACATEDRPDVNLIGADPVHLALFGREPLSFSIPGMSDVMPYPSSRFSDLEPSQIDAYLTVFEGIIRGAVQENPPDIIHSNHLWLMSALARRMFPHIPMVVSCHGTDLRQFYNCPHLRRHIMDEIPKIDAVLALTGHQKKQICEMFGLNGDTVHVVPSGYDPALFYPAPKPQPPPFSMVYAGKLSESKGVPLLIESLAHERLRHRPITLTLAGSGAGAEADLCMALAEAQGKRASCLGPLSPSDLAKKMRSSHLFVLPSFFEGLPLVLIEALASGCRIVATDLPGIRELVADLPPGCGELIELPPLETVDRPFDTDRPLIRDRLARAMENVIRTIETDGPLSSDIIDHVRRHHSWETVFNRIEALYKSLV
ncbi:glycosyltransferase [Desulfatiferula olefinivorans]